MPSIHALRTAARRRAAPLWQGLALGLLLTAQTAHAQGNDSVTSTMAAHTNPRPAPLSTITATTVAGGHPVPGLPIPVARPDRPAGGLDLPGEVRLASPNRLACGDIRDQRARARCQSRRPPPAPPAEAAP